MTPSFAQQLTTTLLHFVWQGTLIALVYSLIKQQTTSPQIRYGAGVGALLASILWPVWTLVSTAGAPQPAVLVTPVASADFSPGIAYAVSWIWCAGATLCSLRTSATLLYLRFRVLGKRLQPTAQLRTTVDRLGQQLGLHRVRLWTSQQIDVPQVVGFFRPVVLVPLAMLSRLTPSQLEAVLLHELIHLRRRDPLVQALQTLVESLLFFHPAVWWLSSQLRQEREFCCDAEVVACTGSPLDYAQALLSLESQRTPTAPTLALNGGSLMERIKRIVEPEVRRTTRPTAALAGLLLVALAITTLWAAGPGRGDSGPIPWMPEEVRQWESLLAEAGREHQVDPALLSIIALVESKGNPDAVSSSGARGLMQIMPATGQKIAQVRGIKQFETDDLMDPAINADFAAYLLSDYLHRFENEADPAETIEWAAAAYNGGLKRVMAFRAGKAELSEETQNYKSKVRAMWLHRDSDRMRKMKK